MRQYCEQAESIVTEVTRECKAKISLSPIVTENLKYLDFDNAAYRLTIPKKYSLADNNRVIIETRLFGTIAVVEASILLTNNENGCETEFATVLYRGCMCELPRFNSDESDSDDNAIPELEERSPSIDKLVNELEDDVAATSPAVLFVDMRGKSRADIEQAIKDILNRM